MNKLENLVDKLKEIFQINQPELDFGIYRILKIRANEIEDFLSTKLRENVRAILDESSSEELKKLNVELNNKVKQYQEDGLDPDNVPKVVELRKQISELITRSSEQENEIYSHLLTFFSRYYDQGDFISQRRYKGDTYSLPYAGEEVILYWANKDQYYTKSGENFTNFTVRLNEDKVVHFRLIAADTAKDNRKDNEKERRFVLIDRHVRLMIDEEGEEYEEEVLPIQEISKNELVIWFEYKTMPKGTKQVDLVSKAAEKILADENVKINWTELSVLEPTEKNPNRTILEKYLSNYTAKNTADYFIHKDLGRFLRRELDFYIKNEVMNLDDIQNVVIFNEVEKKLRTIQGLRSIAHELIDFLTQLEEFQKKLWLKKKIVVEAHYCLTLDRVPQELYPEITGNLKQWEQWVQLGLLNKEEKRETALLKTNQFLMVDTSLYEQGFKEKLLRSIENIDRDVDGLLIHSDNFQALNLLQERYREQIKCVYIDPPYNTDSTPIIYKNGYKHSSWASLMYDRLSLSMNLMRRDAVKAVAIDDAEMENLSKIMKEVAPNYRFSRVTVVHNPKGSITKDFNRTHEYTLFLTREDVKGTIARTMEENNTPRKMRRWGENSLRTERRLSFYPIYVREGQITRIGTVPEDSFHPAGRNVKLPTGEIEIWPIDQNGVERRWNFGLDSITENLSRITVQESSGTLDLFITHELTVPKTVWTGGEFDAGNYGNSLLVDMLGKKLFDFPKSINLVKRCVYLATSEHKDSIVLDYFGGSGTTGHAVISLNREDGGKRKYILVEQGEYFDTVVKSRIQKTIYSSEWKKGKPTNPETGISQCFKVLKLESYEDTLNNLELYRSKDQEDFLSQLDDPAREDYLLRYMLDVESRGSLLTAKSFYNPFNCKLKVTVDSAGAYEERKVDLVETFNYLIGLEVQTIDSQLDKGVVWIKGKLPSGEKTLILWRDCNQVSYEELNQLCENSNINPLNSDFDVVYVNGDHNIPSAFTTSDQNGEINYSVKIRQIESEFLERMFLGEV
ncbi:DNA methyltransferase [Bacillus anthracis]|uniref:site-specific DNA-methyltransferase n=1 Tax=Bacillus anthracis TaxID=1392 RepID=UPI002DBC2DC3|nr:DNA methyltransferase [Bacillus anthracis]MEB9909174.1 DNA methyltransferase [Bacillus anthracis]MEC1955973.1 DNA methyltransferase [Bacillus anthracis]